MTMQDDIAEFNAACRTFGRTLIAVWVVALERVGLVTRPTFAWYVAGALTRCYL